MDVDSLDIVEEASEGLENRSALLGPGPYHTALVGGTAMGKSFSFCKIISRLFHHPVAGVYLSAKHESQDAFKSLKGWCEEKGFPFTYVGPTWTRQAHDEVLQDDLPCWCFIDDYTMTDPGASLVNDLFRRGRHQNCYIAVTTQAFKDLDAAVRTNVGIWAIFPSGSRSHAAASLRGVSTGLCPRTQLMPAYDWVCNPNHLHSFLCLIRNGPALVISGETVPRLYDVRNDLAEVRITRPA